MRHKVKRTNYFFWLFSFAFCHLPFALFAQFSLTSAITKATCSYDNNGSISVSVSGGIIPYTYSWSPGGETTSSVTGLVPGTYSFTVTDNTGSDSTVSLLVGPSPMVNDTLNRIKYPYCGNNGRILLGVSGGTGTYQYAWSTGSTDALVIDLGAGGYSVLVTDANSCTANFSFLFTEKKCFVEPRPYFTPNDDGVYDTWTIVNSEYYENARLIVFDRWGTRVYEHKGTYEPWDGKSYLGIPVPDAVYYYFFYQDKDDKQKEAVHGSVTILR